MRIILSNANKYESHHRRENSISQSHYHKAQKHTIDRLSTHTHTHTHTNESL